MSDELEAILRSVASGELSPEAAMKAIDEQEARPPVVAEPTSSIPAFGSPGAETTHPSEPVVPSTTTGRTPTTAHEPAGASNPVTGRSSGTPPVTGTVSAVRVLGSYRAVQIVADPTVAQLYVTGPHTVRQEGTTLVVSGSGPLDDEQQSSQPNRQGNLFGGFSFSDLPRTISWARSWKNHQLMIRVNPDLLVELEATGAELKISGLAGGFKGRVVASSLKADKLQGRLDLEAVSSSVKVSAVPAGESRLYVESSSARLTLLPGSDLRISGTNRMGRLQLPDRPASTLPLDGQTTESVVGSGRDRLEIESIMSSVTVGAQVWDEVPL